MAELIGMSGLEAWVDELSLIEQQQDRRAFLVQQPQLSSKQSVQKLYAGVVHMAGVDLKRAERLAEAATWIAEDLRDPYAFAQSARAVGHVLYLNGKYRPAIAQYEKALEIFDSLGSELDVARTINGALQSLIYDGQYERAFSLGERARSIFEANGDRLRLARLNSNIANIFYRQDRLHAALELYESAYHDFLMIGEAQDIAVVVRNLAVCYIGLNDFDRAQKTYELAREYCKRHGFRLLEVKADYNIAYLYYLRGEYLRAIELYDATRLRCEEVGDKYHKALCDLDESEIYLELNLTEGGADLARSAFVSFRQLGLEYETAKAAAFFAIALSHQGRHKEALEIFDQSRELFVKEKNELWPALIDVYKALVLYEAEEDEDAYDLAVSALNYFRSSPLQAKAAICELLLASMQLRAGAVREARQQCDSALTRLREVESPSSYQAYFVLGQVEEAVGEMELARKAYQNAYEKLEDLRSHLGREELKIAFLQNKLAIYEGLVITSLSSHSGQERAAFEYIERAKSRSLTDLIAFRAPSLISRNPEHSAPMEQLRALRQKLTWIYHQIELEELNPGVRSSARIQELKRQGRQMEDALMKAFSQFQTVDQEFVGLQNAATASVEEMLSSLPADAMLVEYYEARGTFYACLATRNDLRIVPVAQAQAVREHLRLLQLQLAKFRLGADYIRPFRQLLLEATQSHLRELYSLIVAPIRKQLNASHLVVVPHGFLHYLPFHALADHDRHLIDDYSISYAPSGSIFALCQGKKATSAGRSLVMAVPDRRAPHIEEEAHFVAKALGDARLFVGDEATDENLRTFGPRSRYIHIATHGYFRQDNPMFSSIRLGSSWLNLFDLYQLHLDAELVTLSGCGTGMNVVLGGDELIGLVRGLLYAGAQTLLVSLWEIHDQSTAELMRDFYEACKTAPNKATALRQAAIRAREEHPHPYFWAAFALVGKIS
jgi:CHAT domain-containing protein/predicted negative regulator of RcsB-dependent stress response